MANFLPLKQYILYCLGRAIRQFRLEDPFLDVGCGIGDVSEFLHRRGWKGWAIDSSARAAEAVSRRFAGSDGVKVRQESLFDHQGRYRTILAMDVVEHMEDDRAALAKIADLIEPGGHVVLTVPSNPTEWRWDDDYYGHVRRYTLPELRDKLAAVGLEILVAWDFTFPLFWILRRLYTRIKCPPRDSELDTATRTAVSSVRNAWETPGISSLLQRTGWLWRPLFGIQFALFRIAIHRGHEMMVIARRR
jgi:SAM-dependent methyltransferase